MAKESLDSHKSSTSHHHSMEARQPYHHQQQPSHQMSLPAPPPPCCCQQIDYDDDEDEDNNNNAHFHDDYDEIEGRYSPKKVTFSDYDQVKLMSMESLLSAATSDASTMEEGISTGVGTISGRSIATRPIAPTVVLQDPTINSQAQISGTPKRNQKAQDKSRLV